MTDYQATDRMPFFSFKDFSRKQDVDFELLTKRPVCLLFSGQGSQYRQMGRELYNHVKSFQSMIGSLDCIFQEELGISALSDLYDDHHKKGDRYDKTILTHPAIFMVQLATAHTLMANGVYVTGVLGASLGEYIAAVVAGAVTAEDMMRAIVRSAMILEKRCEPGGMLSVIGSQDLYYSDAFIYEQTTFAGKYMNNLFVLAGSSEKLKDVADYLAAKNVTSLLLPVSKAFHSSALDICQEELEGVFSGLDVKPLKMDFYSSLMGRQVDELSSNHFAMVGREPINCIDAISSLLEANQYEDFIDVGPFGSLAGVIKKTRVANSQKCHVILTPFNSALETSKAVVRKFTACQRLN